MQKDRLRLVIRSAGSASNGWIEGRRTLVWKGVFELISYVWSLGLKMCLLANGYFVDGEVYGNLFKNEVFTFISIDGLAKTNEVLRGKGSCKAALSAVEKPSRELESAVFLL